MSAQPIVSGNPPDLSEPGPGRNCPLDYRYRPQDLARSPLLAADVLWIVGGLYGNLEALQAINRLVVNEAQGSVQVVANGDFHWFDADTETFASVQQGIGGWHAMRGNVETELARPLIPTGQDVGCGCGYPESVSQADVDRSNEIIRRLRETAHALQAGPSLSALPHLRRARVGALSVGIVHGDHQSMAGWRLAHDSLSAGLPDDLLNTFAQADIGLLACSHTCLPVAITQSMPGRHGDIGVINNGAAGMANFSGTTHGVVTRIARAGLPPPERARVLYRTELAGCDVAAVAVDFDLDAFLSRFDRIWPEGSPAALSYRRRILSGPDHSLSSAIRGSFRAVDGPRAD